MNRAVIKVIARLFGEQEEILVRPDAAVGDRLRQGVGLVPDDVLTQIPAVILQGQGEPPRDAEQVLGAQVAATRGIIFLPNALAVATKY